MVWQDLPFREAGVHDEAPAKGRCSSSDAGESSTIMNATHTQYHGTNDTNLDRVSILEYALYLSSIQYVLIQFSQAATTNGEI